MTDPRLAAPTSAHLLHNWEEHDVKLHITWLKNVVTEPGHTSVLMPRSTWFAETCTMLMNKMQKRGAAPGSKTIPTLFIKGEAPDNIMFILNYIYTNEYAPKDYLVKHLGDTAKANSGRHVEAYRLAKKFGVEGLDTLAEAALDVVIKNIDSKDEMEWIVEKYYTQQPEQGTRIGQSIAVQALFSGLGSRFIKRFPVVQADMDLADPFKQGR